MNIKQLARLLLLATLAALSLLAQETRPVANSKDSNPPPACHSSDGIAVACKDAPTITQLQAKITTLEVQLAKANASLKRLSLRAQYEAQICSLPEMAQAIVEDAAADAKVKALPK